MPGIISDKDFRKNVLEGGSVEGCSIRKQFTAEEIKTVGDDDSRILQFTISTETVDRMGDVIKANGWELESFEKNPVVLFAHDSRRPPVGRAIGVEIKGRKLRAQAEFMDDEVDRTGFSDTIFRMLKAKFLRATSVGFIPKEWEFIKEKDDEGHEFITGFKFTKQELLEFSVVPVPANPDALMGARSAGIDLRPLEAWYEEALDKWVEYRDCLMVPKKDVELFYRSVRRGLPESVLLTDKEKDMATVVEEEELDQQAAKEKEVDSEVKTDSEITGITDEANDLESDDELREVLDDDEVKLEEKSEELEEKSADTNFVVEIRVGDAFISCKSGSMESINTFIEKQFGDLGKLFKVKEVKDHIEDPKDAIVEEETDTVDETKETETGELDDLDLDLDDFTEDEIRELVQEVMDDLRGKVK